MRLRENPTSCHLRPNREWHYHVVVTTRWLSNAFDLGMLLCRLWKFHDVGCENVLLEGDRKNCSEVGPGCR